MSYPSADRVRYLAKTALLLSLLFFSCSYAAEPAKIDKPTAAAVDVHPDSKPVAQTPAPAKSTDENKPATAVAAPPAAKSTGIDAVLVLDSSGSMKHTDPLNLRLPAAKLFISLLGKSDRAGVISFSDQGYPVVGLTAAHDDLGRKKLLQAVDKVSSKGMFTNLHDALVKAIAMLGEDKEQHTRYVILMSDGQMDTGDAVRDQKLKAQLKDVLVPELAKANITLYTIAFTQESDVALLKAIGEAAHGQFRMAEHDKDLHEVFTSLFETAKTPDMLPMEGGEFHADEAIQEVTIVASKDDPKVQISLRAPDGKRLTAQDVDSEQNKDLRWFTSPAFDMITLAHPAAGTWKVLYSNGQNKAYIVTDLGIVTELKDQDIKRGETLTVTAWLSRGGETVTQREILQSTNFMIQLQSADGTRNEFMMRDTGQLGDKKLGDGIYTGTALMISPGPQKLRLIAKSATFERETLRNINVLEPPPPPPVVAPAKPVQAAPVKVAPKAPVHDQPKPVEKSLSMVWVLAGFVVFNVLVGGIVILVIWLRRRRADAKSAAATTVAVEE